MRAPRRKDEMHKYDVNDKFIDIDFNSDDSSSVFGSESDNSQKPSQKGAEAPAQALADVYAA